MSDADVPKLNIAMLGHKRIPSREGGIEVVVEELAVRMAERGHQVTCYNRKGHHVAGSAYDSGHSERLVRAGVKVRQVPTLDRKGLAALTSSFFAALAAAFGDYDVVHFHAEGPCAMMWLPKLRGKRCVATIHGLDWQRAKWKGGLGEKYIRLGEKAAVRFADEIIVLSEGVQTYFRDTYGRETTRIPNGVTKPSLSPAELIRQNYALEKDSYLLYLGRLVPEKGAAALIDAFRGVQTDKRLVIAGGSSDSDQFVEELHWLAADDDRIVFTGFVQNQLLAELYSNAYLYVLPSEVEGMPLTLLEALSYDCCCVTSDIAECACVLGGHGVTFPQGDTEALREVLQALCDDEAAVQTCKRGASEFVCETYQWDSVVDQTMELYRASMKK
ncbi:MAG: glycosyltransferase family 4 protein [Clostridiales bacterium]|nr:glycosyltransferase family 4 protein [Clostridiales bacterium]